MNDVGSNTALIAGQVITLVTVFGGLVVQIYRERRNRRWDMEDRAALARRVATSNADLTSTVTRQHEVTRAAIAENTLETKDAASAAREAYSEANHVNHKLEALGISLAENAGATDRKRSTT